MTILIKKTILMALFVANINNQLYSMKRTLDEGENQTSQKANKTPESTKNVDSNLLKLFESHQQKDQQFADLNSKLHSENNAFVQAALAQIQNYESYKSEFKETSNNLPESSRTTSEMPDYEHELEKIKPDQENKLHLAAFEGNFETIQKELDKAGPFSKTNLVLKQDKRGNTALHFAALNGNLEVIKILCRAAGLCVGMLISTKNCNGDSVFHFVCAKNNLEALTVLREFATQFERNSIHSISNNNKQTPLSIARQADHTSIIDFLKKLL